KYPDNIPEPDEIEIEDLNAILSEGYELLLEPASRLLYKEQNGVLKFWGNGEELPIVESFATQLKAIADGKSVPFNNKLSSSDILENIVQLLNDSIIMLLPPAE
ncbi:winged helix domain-containing protein, partial [Acinetobacter baumannii]